MRNNISKLALTAALMLAITFTFSCSGDSGGGGGNGDQANISSGTEASKETSSSSKETGNSSSSSEAEDNSSSSSLSSTGNSSSSNVNSSSSKGSESGVKKDQISGVSQKGPFVKGSTATLYELDDKFVQTGRSFKDIIADDKGSFDIKINVELASPYAMLEADGYYRNEVTGNASTGTIKLYAIADIREKSNVNVNILTHLEYYRVQKLVEAGKSLQDAKKQAQKEILAVFGITGEFKNSEDMSIFGTTDGDAALLAISLLLQGNLTEGQFVERLADFRLGFRETGTWDNKTAKDDMADWASNNGNAKVDYCEYAEKSGVTGTCWIMPTSDKCASGRLVKSCFESTEQLYAKIRSNILGWNLSSTVPDFEKYVNNYWSSYLGVCDAKEAGKIKDGPGGKKYVCRNGEWNEQQKITCNGGYGDKCDKRLVTLAIDECVEINFLGWTEQYYLPNIIMLCSALAPNASVDNLPDVSVTLSLNGKSTTTSGEGYVEQIVPLGKIKLGDNEFGSLCLTAISGATSVKCPAPYPGN